MGHEKYENYLTDASKCSVTQNFCNWNRQTVSKLFKVDDAFPSINQNLTIISPSIINEIKSFLQEIHDYGTVGTRTPEQTKINQIPIPVSDIDKITAKYYNKILDALDIDTSEDSEYILHPEQILEKKDFDRLKTYIEKFQINENRCNVCNTNKNCGEYVQPSTPTPTPINLCFVFFEFYSGGGGCGGGGGDGCPCGGQCLMSEGSSSPCSVCEGCNTYSN